MIATFSLDPKGLRMFDDLRSEDNDRAQDDHGSENERPQDHVCAQDERPLHVPSGDHVGVATPRRMSLVSSVSRSST